MTTIEMWRNLTKTHVVRPPKLKDAHEVTELFNLCSREMIGANDYTVDEVRNDWTTPGFNLETDGRLIFKSDGELIAHIEVWAISKPPIRPWLLMHIRPDQDFDKLGSAIFPWAIARAELLIPKVPQEARVTLQAHAVSSYQPMKQLLEKNNMKLIRHSWQMAIDLAAPIAQPKWPEGIILRTYDHARDGEAVYRADYDSFRDHFGFVEETFEEGYPQWIHSMIKDEHYDPSLWFLAVQNDEIVGGSLCRAVSWEDPEMGWVRTLFTRRPWRRNGIALALLTHTFHEFKRRGLKRVGLGVDAENLTGATRLYEKAGMKIRRQYDRYELELRSGIELSTEKLID